MAMHLLVGFQCVGVILGEIGFIINGDVYFSGAKETTFARQLITDLEYSAVPGPWMCGNGRFGRFHRWRRSRHGDRSKVPLHFHLIFHRPDFTGTGCWNAKRILGRKESRRQQQSGSPERSPHAFFSSLAVSTVKTYISTSGSIQPPLGNPAFWRQRALRKSVRSGSSFQTWGSRTPVWWPL